MSLRTSQPSWSTLRSVLDSDLDMTVESVNDRGSSSPWNEPAPPLPKGSYKPENALEDLPGISYALHLFLASHMVESEDYCIKSDPKKLGFSIMSCHL